MTNSSLSCWDENLIDAGPLGFQYLSFHFCVMEDFQFLSVLLLLAFLLLLFYLLGDTADSYFSPTLATICEKLHVAYDVAGVTFLAFGNGAPDVFASVAAYTRGGTDEALIGLNALTGAAVFVMTVVVGCVVLVTPVAVQPRSFVRDIVCYAAALGILSYVLSDGTISLVQASFFLIFYAAYVGLVVAADLLAKRKEAPTELYAGGVTSAFWHSPSAAAAENREHEPSYTFLTLDRGAEPLMGSDGEEEGGVAGPGQFAHAIVDDYFGDGDGGDCVADADGGAGMMRASEPPEDDDDDGEDAEHERLSAAGDVELAIMSVEEPEDAPVKMWRPFKRLSKRGGSVWDALYHSHLRWRHSTRSALLDSTFGPHSRLDKALAVALYPFKLMRDATIPSIEDGEWSRLRAGGYPLWSSLFLVFVGGQLNAPVGAAPLWLLVALFGSIAGAFVFCTTHTSRPPSARWQQLAFVFAGFLLCIGWIYTLASELVSLLLALGKLSGVPSSVLGLTVLAWGNSLGDLITNIAVAKSGYADMAIAGCYGGPLFNLLVSLGVAFTYNCAIAYPEPVKLPEDDHVVTSVVFLFVSLACSIAVVALSAWSYPRRYGAVLVGMYVVYSVVNVMEAVGWL